MAFRPLAQTVSASISELAIQGREGRLLIYAGAGISIPEPTNLPSGSELARSTHVALQVHIPEAMKSCPLDDLLAVADAAVGQVDGERLLRDVICHLFDFTTAQPNRAHHALATLLVEGVVKLMTTNWDTCIERAVDSGERVEAVVTEQDALNIHVCALLKVHGCATRPSSLLVSSSQLASPPLWAQHSVGASLGTSTAVFLGLGDVPRYVQTRIVELLRDLKDLTHVRIVARSISPIWSEIVPDEQLPTNHKLEMDADEFSADLVNAYVKTALADLAVKAATHDEDGTYSALGVSVAEAADKFVDALRDLEGVSFLRWLRRAAWNWSPGAPVLAAPAGTRALLALALLGARRAICIPRVRDQGSDSTPPVLMGLDYDQDVVQLLISRGAPSARVMKEAVRRLGEDRAAGRIGLGQTVLYLCVGQEGPLLPEGLPANVVADVDPASVVDGALAPPRFVSADEVLAGTVRPFPASFE
jgi:hypothetical protein